MSRRAAPPVFLDRDGTLIVERHYLSHPQEVRLEAGVAEGLTRLQQGGHPLIVVSNQSGIGKGLFTEQDAHRVNDKVAELLRHAGIEVRAWYLCPHVADDGCDCRKPQCGMALAAARDCHVALPGSFVIGDKQSDLELADAIGGIGILVTTGHGLDSVEWARAHSRVVVDGLGDAADFILGPMRQ